jgi:hypothetical protein
MAVFRQDPVYLDEDAMERLRLRWNNEAMDAARIPLRGDPHPFAVTSYEVRPSDEPYQLEEDIDWGAA